MECKVQKRPVIVFNNDSGSSIPNGTCTSCSRCGSKFVVWANLGLLFVLFLSNIFLHYKWMTISNELSELQQSQQRRVPAQASFFTSPVQDLTSDSTHNNNQRVLTKRNNRQTRRRRRDLLRMMEHQIGRNEQALVRSISRPAVHLRGFASADRPPPVQNMIFAPTERNNIFRWEHQDRNYPDPSFRYVNDMQNSNKVIGVNITNPGLYLIYSQVVVKGPYAESDPAYGVETMKVGPSGQREVLLQSFVTQDGRGHSYQDTARTPREQFPVDFINHMGMFKLECDDIVYVRIPNQSSHGKYLRVPAQTHFGLQLINPKYNYVHQLNGC